MGNIATLRDQWRNHCQQTDSSSLPQVDCTLIVDWLLGADAAQKEALPPEQWLLFEKGIAYRYRVLTKYLAMQPSQRFGRLLRRLSHVVTLRQQIQTWISLSRDRRRTVYDVLEEVIQEMLQRDRYLQQELGWLRSCKPPRSLREAFLCTVLEEYCLRPIQNQPLISYRFVNLMRRYQRSGMTNVPASQSVKLLSTELEIKNSEQTLNLLDNEAIARHQTKEELWQQDFLRQAVMDDFFAYLQENIKDPLAVPWLKLYLQGKTQEAIAQALDIPIKKSYRLRDKVKYHAIHNFAIKTKPALVAAWLQTSLAEHQLGLTSQQWETLQTQLTPEQQQLLSDLQTTAPSQKSLTKLDDESPSLLQQWSKIYLAAQKLRG
ncbi:HetZ-related protein 2 [[Limnothrix rosea] IAM M-220]|uniref:HetZ-related protein 2 n=1 Tax=[Limnothrix rosea] IAM M-220 TaxID=454133 RepID=UPI000966597C|nr:HetZ-related protein 2 [[Limnothrix rosea] IAM M-220]OKH17479.1 hypothetical protein NIES208_09055 [[Limnothrix rosea] IAM M-220]